MKLFLYVCLTVAFQLSAALPNNSTEVESLLQLKALTTKDSSLQTWQTGTDPCGSSSCTMGSCNWQNVACSQQRVTQVNMSGTSLQGPLPADWRAPSSLTVLDLSNNQELCGSLPADLTQRGPKMVQVKASGSSIGQPCVADSGQKQEQGPPVTLSDVAKGMIGLGFGVAAVAAAAAGTILVLRKKQQGGQDSQEALPENDLARTHDSVTVTKRKKQVRAADLHAANKDFLIQAGPGDNLAEKGPHKQNPNLRMVVFAGDFEDGPADEQKKRLRASNIQDSVVIIRKKVAEASRQQTDGSSNGGSNAGSQLQSEEEDAVSSELQQGGNGGVVFPIGTLPQAVVHPAVSGIATVQPALRGSMRTISGRRVQFGNISAEAVLPLAEEQQPASR